MRGKSRHNSSWYFVLAVYYFPPLTCSSSFINQIKRYQGCIKITFSKKPASIEYAGKCGISSSLHMIIAFGSNPEQTALQLQSMLLETGVWIPFSILDSYHICAQIALAHHPFEACCVINIKV